MFSVGAAKKARPRKVFLKTNLIMEECWRVRVQKMLVYGAIYEAVCANVLLTFCPCVLELSGKRGSFNQHFHVMFVSARCSPSTNIRLFEKLFNCILNVIHRPVYCTSWNRGNRRKILVYCLTSNKAFNLAFTFPFGVHEFFTPKEFNSHFRVFAQIHFSGDYQIEKKKSLRPKK